MVKTVPFDRSLASHPKSDCWNYSKNIVLPENVYLKSNQKCWFICDKCEHDFEIALSNVSLNRWCPYCANKKLCNDADDCIYCFDKSFASIDISKKWSALNDTSPSQVMKFSHKKYLFDCGCGHTYEKGVSDMSAGVGCPYCSVCPKLLCAKKECKQCFDKSFASHPKSAYWNEQNAVQPREVFKHTANRYIFNCDKCSNVFENRVSHISDGVWCPLCINKTEKIFYDKMIQIYPSLLMQIKVDWCKNIKHLPFDFMIDERKIIIELDGEQHLGIQVGKWKTPEHNRKRDLYKIKCANENGYSIIRILQDDVWKNKMDWVKELTLIIEKITTDKIVQNVYICKKGEYDNFENEL